MKGQIILDSKPGTKIIRNGLGITVTTEGGRGGRRKTLRYEITNMSRACKVAVEYQGHSLGLGGVSLKALDPGEVHIVTPARGGRMTAIRFDQL